MFEECHVQNYLYSSEMYFHCELTFIQISAHLTETEFQIYEMINQFKGFANPDSINKNKENDCLKWQFII